MDRGNFTGYVMRTGSETPVSVPVNIAEQSIKPMKIRTLVAFVAGAAAFAMGGPLGAQIDTIELPEVVISDNRMDIPFGIQSRSIQVIRKEEIRQAPANSVAELLQYVAGVDVRQRGVNGAQTDIGIRGGTFDQTLILLNGVKISDLQTGHHNMNLPVDWEAIERIEVLKGPAARIYGQNAFAGAINIVARAPETAFVRASALAGDFGLGRVSAGVSFPGANARRYLSYAHDFAGGYRYNTDYRMHTATYMHSVEGEKGVANFFAGWTGRDFGANGFYGSPSFSEQYEKLHTTLVSLDARRTAGRFVFRPRAYWRFNQDEYLFNRSNPSAFRNLHRSHNLGVELHSQYTSSLGVTGVGIDVGRQLLFSNRLGNRERTVWSVFAEQRLVFANQRFDLTPGILWNSYSDFGAQFLPGIEGGWQLSPQWRLYANAGYTYRVPTFTDLYYEDPGNKGNPDLKPESALAYEAGLKWVGARTSASAAYFLRQSDDLIDWTKPTDADPWRTRNLGDIRFQGMEFALHARVSKTIPAAFFSYTYIDAAQGADPAFRSRYALDQLRHQWIGGIDIRVGKHWSAALRGRFLDRINLEDYAVADARIRWQSNRWGFFAETTNLTNTGYTETNLVPMPGRWASAGFSVQWDKK